MSTFPLHCQYNSLESSSMHCILGCCNLSLELCRIDILGILISCIYFTLSAQLACLCLVDKRAAWFEHTINKVSYGQLKVEKKPVREGGNEPRKIDFFFYVREFYQSMRCILDI